MEYILESADVSKSYGDSLVLNAVNVQVPHGSVFGLLGPNGAGKTTLIRILTQITAPDSGEVRFAGRPIQPLDTQRMGYLPEERGLYRKMKVWEQALYLVRLKGVPLDIARIRLNEWFTKLHMETWANKPVETLSKGMQQKLQFVVTVAHNPEFLILDEPFSGFDPVNAAEMRDHILDLKSKGTSIILSTHNMPGVEELCDHVCLINKGEVVLNGTLKEVKSRFSKSLFEVEFSGSKIAFATAVGYQFEILNIHESHERFTAMLRAHGTVPSNSLLSALTQCVNVHSFREKLPTIGDIFIDLVQQPQPLTNA